MLFLCSNKNPKYFKLLAGIQLKSPDWLDFTTGRIFTFILSSLLGAGSRCRRAGRFADTSAGYFACNARHWVRGSFSSHRSGSARNAGTTRTRGSATPNLRRHNQVKKLATFRKRNIDLNWSSWCWPLNTFERGLLIQECLTWKGSETWVRL